MQNNGDNGKRKTLGAKRTTIDHLLSLEATVRKAQANSEHIVSIFFDMEKNI